VACWLTSITRTKTIRSKKRRFLKKTSRRETRHHQRTNIHIHEAPSKNSPMTYTLFASTRHRNTEGFGQACQRTVWVKVILDRTGTVRIYRDLRARPSKILRKEELPRLLIVAGYHSLFRGNRTRRLSNKKERPLVSPKRHHNQSASPH
jgi:hypothetical protein